MKLGELLSGIKYHVLQNIPEIPDIPDIRVTGISYDSRSIEKGHVFICKGFNFRREYITDAISKGAAAIVLELVNIPEDPPGGMPFIIVENARLALACAADNLYGHISTKIAVSGITGTKGKTTAAFMMKSVFDAAGIKAGLIGTVGYMSGGDMLHLDRTTPEAPDLQQLFAKMYEEGCKEIAMEVSSHALDLNRVSCVRFDTAVFTNLTRDHMDYHGNFTSYFEAKARLFEMAKTGIVNNDSEYGRKIAKSAKCAILTYGIDRNADITAEEISYSQDGVSFLLGSPWGAAGINVPIPGRFTVYNALAAASACMNRGISIQHVADGLKNVRVPGRAEITAEWNGARIMIDYAHSPDSLENILTAVREFAAGRVICVVGCGGDRDRTKRPIMAEISGRLANLTVLTSDNPRSEDPEAIIDEMEAGISGKGHDYIRMADRREAIKYSLLQARNNDIIVLAGKGHETTQQFSDRTVSFDERLVVREIIKELESGISSKRQ